MPSQRDDPANGDRRATRTRPSSPCHLARAHAPLVVCQQVKQQVESQARCFARACPRLPAPARACPHNPHNPLTVFSRVCADQGPRRECSAFEPHLPRLPPPAPPAPPHPLTFAALAHLRLHRAGRLLVVARRAHRAHGRGQERLQGARRGRARGRYARAPPRPTTTPPRPTTTLPILAGGENLDELKAAFQQEERAIEHGIDHEVHTFSGALAFEPQTRNP